jgi:hypothetical protein
MTSARRRLKNRRTSELFDFECAGFSYVAGISRFDDGTVAEIFITNGKIGTDAAIAAQDSAIVASLALQHGVDVETLRKALARNKDGSAVGPLGFVLDRLADQECKR